MIHLKTSGSNQTSKLITILIFLKQYFKAGLIHKQDLFDNEVVFLSLDTIENQTIKTHIIEYASLKRAIFQTLMKSNTSLAPLYSII